MIVTGNAAHVAWDEFGIPIPILFKLVKRSAVVTHPRGNRRFGDLIFKLEGHDVTDIALVDDSKGLCSSCYGLGIHQQHDEEMGQVVDIPCMDCEKYLTNQN